MDNSKYQYVAVIMKEPDAPYVATVPDFGALITTGDTIEEAKANLPDAIATYLDGMEIDGRPLPQARSRKAVFAAIEEPIVTDYIIEVDNSSFPVLTTGTKLSR